MTFLKEQHDKVDGIRISNSADGYHIYGHLKKKSDQFIEMNELNKRLVNYFHEGEYDINRRTGAGEKINLDLSSMYRRGSHTVIGALNLNGTMCMNIGHTNSQLKMLCEDLLLSYQFSALMLKMV